MTVFVRDMLLVWAWGAACGVGYLGGRDSVEEGAGLGEGLALWFGEVFVFPGFILIWPPIAVFWLIPSHVDAVVCGVSAVLLAVCAGAVGRSSERRRKRRRAMVEELLLLARQSWAEDGEACDPPWWSSLWYMTAGGGLRGGAPPRHPR